jgi:hypothetical protein
MYLLVVRHIDCVHNARHLGAERSQVAANVSIIRDLFNLAAFPCIPVTRDGDQNSQSEKQHENGRYIVLPPRTLARNYWSVSTVCGTGFATGGAGPGDTGEVDIRFAP